MPPRPAPNRGGGPRGGGPARGGGAARGGVHVAIAGELYLASKYCVFS